MGHVGDSWGYSQLTATAQDKYVTKSAFFKKLTKDKAAETAKS